jgi:hypothetical protein
MMDDNDRWFMNFPEALAGGLSAGFSELFCLVAALAAGLG